MATASLVTENAAIAPDLHLHAGQRRSQQTRGIPRRCAGIVGNAAAFAGTVEIVDLQAGIGEDLLFESQRERGPGREGEVDGRVFQDPGAMPGPPHRWHGGNDNRGMLAQRLLHHPRKRHRHELDRHAVQQQGQHDVGKTVGMRQRDHRQIRNLRRQPHGGNQPVGIRHHLRPGEENPARHAGGTGRVFHQPDVGRGCAPQHRLRRVLFHRNHRLPVTPGTEDFDEKRRTPGPGDHRFARAGRWFAPRPPARQMSAPFPPSIDGGLLGKAP